MATYDIAPATTGSEIGMAQMRYGLHNKADYNASNLYTAGAISLRTISQSPSTYQGDLVSQTWNTASPYGFDELAGETWSDATAATVSYSFTDTTGGTLSVTVRLGGPTGTVLYNAGTGTGTLNASVGDTIYVSATGTHPSDPYSLTAEYRVPDSGVYTGLFFDASGPGGGATSGASSFVITSPNTTAGLTVSMS